MNATADFGFGDKVRIKGNRTLFLVTGSEWITRGDGSQFERVYLASYKHGTHADADKLERAA